MNHRTDDWETAFRDDIRKVLPEVALPPDLNARIEKRIADARSAVPAAEKRSAHVVPLPRRRRPLYRYMRWVAAAAVAVVALGSVGPTAQRLERKWFGPHAQFPIAAPFAFAAAAAAGSPTAPGLRQFAQQMSFELSTPLPELPERGPIHRAETTFSSAFVESVRTRLGIKEPVRPEWEKVPVVTPLQAYRAGPFAVFASGAWGYDDQPRVASPSPPGTTPPADDPGPAISDEEAINIARGWLEKAGLYPPDPVSTSVSGTGADIDVDFTAAKGSPLAAADDLPGIHVWIRSGKIFQASGVWPKSSSPAGDVPLRTAREAWADLQADSGAVVGTVGRVNAELQSHMTIHSVSLDRVLVRSLENRWYYIPVVLFEGEIKDTKGQGHKAIAYVTAVKPTPGQGGYELKAALPQAPAQLPSVQISKPQAPGFHAWKPDTAIQTFRVPTTQSVSDAAVRVATAAGLDPKLIGEPELMWSPTEIFASVPVSWNGLPAIHTLGDPQRQPAVWTRFGLDGRIRSVTILESVAKAAGDSVPLISPEEAWGQVQAGGGTVKVIHEGGDFPNVHFAAHRTTIDRVELAYNVDQAAWAEGQPAKPSYFFWGKAIVGEDFTEKDVVVIIPATRP